MGVASFANSDDCTSTPGGFARLTPSLLQWIRSVKVKQKTLCLLESCEIFVFYHKVNSWQHKIEIKLEEVNKELSSFKNDASVKLNHVDDIFHNGWKVCKSG